MFMGAGERRISIVVKSFDPHNPDDMQTHYMFSALISDRDDLADVVRKLITHAATPKELESIRVAVTT